jgi:hypothetical protein
MNPYEAPANKEPVGRKRIPSEENVVKKPFRWRVIPASISWLVGVFCLVILPMALYNNWDSLAVNFDRELPWILWDIAMLSLFPLTLAYGVSFICAGNRWMKGRWASAISLDVIPCLLMMGFRQLTDYLCDWALSLP